MSFPTPCEGESQEDFRGRFMNEMEKEFPDRVMRWKMCNEEWKQYKGQLKEIRKVPAKELVFASGKLQFAESFSDGDPVAEHTPVKLVVRTNSIVETYFGSIVHDHHGMTHKDKVPLDWSHRDGSEEMLGYLDKFDISNEQIECFGQLVSVELDDLAARIVKQMRAGIPYESSIYFGGQGLKIEEVGENTSVEVNGKKFNGPIMVVRDWPLRGVAICPHGADNQTSTSLAFNEEKIPVLVISHKENKMAENVADSDKKAAEEAAKLKEEKEKALLAEKDSLTEKAKRLAELESQLSKLTEGDNEKIELTSIDGVTGPEFIKSFGDAGAIWFAEGKSFSEASVLYTAKLEERIKALEKRLKTVVPAGKDAVEFEDDDEDENKKKLQERVDKLVPKVGKKLAEFTASLKLPK